MMIYSISEQVCRIMTLDSNASLTPLLLFEAKRKITEVKSLFSCDVAKRALYFCMEFNYITEDQ